MRIPRPAETASASEDPELETYKAQVKLLNESMNVKRLERDAAREHTRAARDGLRLCREAYDAKLALVAPLRDAAKQGGDAARKLRESFR